MDPSIATNMLLNGLTLDIGIIDIGMLSAHLCCMKHKVPEIHLPWSWCLRCFGLQAALSVSLQCSNSSQVEVLNDE